MTTKKAKRFNFGKPRWGLIHFKALEPLIRALEYGEHNYSLYINPDDSKTPLRGRDIPYEKRFEYEMLESGTDNWKNPMNIKQILESMQRHLALLFDGEEYDTESKLHHISHILANAMFYSYHKLIKPSKKK